MILIQEKRKSCCLSQDELAKILAVDRSTVTKWERGQCTPRPDKLIKLSELFGCTIDELLKGNEESKK